METPRPDSSSTSRAAWGLRTRTVVPAARATISATGASASTFPRPTTMMWSAVRAISLKVRGKEDGASLAGEKAHQVADPDDPLRVKSVDGFVEDQGVRVAEQ